MRGRYDRLGYELRRADARNELLIRADRKPYGPPFIIPGIEVDSGEASRVDFTVGARLTMFDVGGYGDELRTDMKTGARTLLTTEYYRLLGETKLFIATNFFV